MISATRLFVGNLPENTEDKDVLSAFSVFGEITNIDLKTKNGAGNENKKFAFVSLSAPNVDVESCIKHFSNQDFHGNRLYVTRARESFLERLQREREVAQKKDEEKVKVSSQENLPKKQPIIKLSEKLNPRKRKIELGHTNEAFSKTRKQKEGKIHTEATSYNAGDTVDGKHAPVVETEADKKKHEAEKKRLESMKKKRQEFKEKQMIIKTGLTGVDKVHNKKVIFSDFDDISPKHANENDEKQNRRVSQKNLFDHDAEGSDDDIDFKVKNQYEGKKGQKVLDLQSRYKSDKRFTLDERFIEDEEEGNNDEQNYDNEEVELGTADEKAKQMNILQDVLGVTIRQRFTETDNKKNKPKLGMLRFDPSQPDHAKFLAPVEAKPQPTKKSKKSKDKQAEDPQVPQVPEGPKVEVSKEQFYKVSDALKEAIAQPSTFSLRSLFGNNEDVDDGPKEQETTYIPLEPPKQKKVKNPLDRKEKNPFVYDSSDSETEEPDNKEVKKAVEIPTAPIVEPKAVWKENLFFTEFDIRLKEGLAFFSKAPETEVQKERRELKSLMKKRIYNKDRKNQMFKKKIGGRKQAMKKPYKNKS
ncbi:probable RNA-binding protein CG14230 [Trichoplusia ni]|uniref:Probable RNA-binding protein CG14230 n=1 Tax=Trichoplusia ni TaxID=7111 RepID=A0A7E5VMD2_TRINI|nr:probable RNA-binding protein CG14230 [Trichoplusia ni]